MNRKALIVGVDHYGHVSPLFGCVNDAHSVKAALDRHADGTKNFDCNILAASGPNDRLTRSDLRASVRDLFAGGDEIALFFLQAMAILNKWAVTCCVPTVRRAVTDFLFQN